MSSNKPQPSRQTVQADLRPGQSVELLKELHILTREGRLNQDSRRKLKQVEHLVHFIEDVIAPLSPHGAELTLADHGAGKSYLGFILYDLLLKDRGSGRVWGIETRADLVERSRALAARLGFARMHFLNIAAADAAQDAALPERIDVVTALHAWKGKWVEQVLPDQNTLSVSLQDITTKDDQTRYTVETNIKKPDGSSYLPKLEVSAQKGEYFFVGGPKFKEGVLVIGIRIL